MASGNFSDDAKQFAQTNPITLVNGDMLVAMIKRLPEAQQQALLAFATAGDYTTPTCPSCGIKMRRVAGTNGRHDFWGCADYPRCRQKLGMRAADRQ
jgi:restriction system protein